jgi:Tfp pilus assembly protein PilX
MLRSPRRLRPARGFALVAMMIAAIVAGLTVLFLVGGLFAEISDDGRITYNIESDT